MAKKISIAFFVVAAVFFVCLAGFRKMDFTPKDCPLTINNKVIALGMTEAEVDRIMGEKKDRLISEYGFYWNIYHENFQNYVQAGFSEGKVVAIYTNSPEFVFEGVPEGTDKKKVIERFGEALEGIVKGNTRYLANGTNNSDDMDIYLIRGGYVTFFYDAHANNSLCSINIIDYDTEQGFDRLHAEATSALKASFEMQNFYVTNAERAKAGLICFESHSPLGEMAFDHALDMAKNNYFNHTNLSEESPLDRAVRYNIKLKRVGENLAMGAQNSLYMHQLLMNSEGHRKNILGDFTHMGVGVAFDDKSVPYMTQNFLK